MYSLPCKELIIGLLSEYFATLLKKTIPEENSHNMFQISSPIVLCLMGRSRMFLGDKIQISSGECKRKE